MEVSYASDTATEDVTEDTTEQHTAQPRKRRKKKRRQKLRSLTKKPDREDSVLLIPAAASPVQDVLQKTASVNPRQLKVTRTVPFPSGALLVWCKDRESVDKLREIVEKIPAVSLKQQRKFQPTVRIHDLDPDITDAEISEEFTSQFEEAPQEISFGSYRATTKTEKIAYLTVSATLFAKLQCVKHVRIGWPSFRVDCSIRVDRCTNCQLLKHRSKFCNRTKRQGPSPKEDCLDCTDHNNRIIQAKLPRNQTRDTKHATNHGSCPSKRAARTK